MTVSTCAAVWLVAAPSFAQVPPKTAPASTTLTVAPANDAPPGGRSRMPALVAFGVGGAGLVLGAITGGIAFAQTEELRKKCGPELLACPESARAQVGDATTMSRISTVSFVFAGLGAAVGVTLLLLPASTSPSSAALVAGPSFLALRGAF